MIKDEALRAVLEKMSLQKKEFKLFDGTPIWIGRLTINDCVNLEKELKINLFGTFAEMARQGAASQLSYELQRTLFFHALKKTYPEITVEEAGVLMTAMPPSELASALAWIFTGAESAG